MRLYLTVVGVAVAAPSHLVAALHLTDYFFATGCFIVQAHLRTAGEAGAAALSLSLLVNSLSYRNSWSMIQFILL
jgi:hypothetical protein